MGKRVQYPEEVKKEVVRLKVAEIYSTQELMKKYGIKNKTQINTWVKWFKDGETHRFAQPVGKQYSYGKGPDDDNDELTKLKKKVAYYEMREELLEKYQEIERKWSQKYLLKS